MIKNSLSLFSKSLMTFMTNDLTPSSPGPMTTLGLLC